MTAILLIGALLLLGPLALAFGADSRDNDPRQRRSSWPADRGEQ